MARNRTLSFYFEPRDTSDTSVYKWSNLSIVGIGHCCTARIRTLANHLVFLVQVTGSLLPQYTSDQGFGPASLQDRPLADMQGTRNARMRSGAAFNGMQWLETAPLSFYFDNGDTSDTSVYKWSNLSIFGIGHCCTARMRTL